MGPRVYRPRKIFYFVVPLFSIVFTLTAVELGLLLFYPAPFAVEKNMYYQPDPYTGYRIQPNSVGYFRDGVPAVANSHGHRDDEVTLEKDGDTFRILLLGDSFSVGVNVYQEEAYPQVLEELLNEDSAKRIEVINAAVGGWGPFHYAQYYEHYGWEFDPDIVLIGFFVGNDTYEPDGGFEEMRTAVLGRRMTRESAEGRFIKLKVFLYNNFNIARLILNRRPLSGRKSRKDCEDISSQYIGIQKRRLPNHLKRDADLYGRAEKSIYQVARIAAGERSRPVTVVLIPDENQINPALQRAVVDDGEWDRYDFKMPQSMLTEMFAGLGISTIDLLPAFIDDGRCLYVNDTHWTAEGHRLAAEVIKSELDLGALGAHASLRAAPSSN